MDLEFKTQEELFKRVKPALHAKLQELRRLNFQEVTEQDLWHFLATSKWKKSKNLMLSDIVNDIMHIDNQKLNLYLKKQIDEEV